MTTLGWRGATSGERDHRGSLGGARRPGDGTGLPIAAGFAAWGSWIACPWAPDAEPVGGVSGTIAGLMVNGALAAWAMHLADPGLPARGLAAVALGPLALTWAGARLLTWVAGELGGRPDPSRIGAMLAANSAAGVLGLFAAAARLWPAVPALALLGLLGTVAGVARVAGVSTRRAAAIVYLSLQTGGLAMVVLAAAALVLTGRG